MKTIFCDRFEERIGFFLDLIKNTSSVLIHVERSYLNENKLTLYQLHTVRWRVRSMVEAIQHGGGMSSVSGEYSVYMCHTISIEEGNRQYGEGYAVWTCHINIEEGVQYRTTKTAQGVVGGCIYL